MNQKIEKEDDDLIFYSYRKSKKTRKNSKKNKKKIKSSKKHSKKNLKKKDKILERDFTYFIKEKNTSISAIRFCKIDNNVVITIYYPYKNIVFTNDNNLKNWNTHFIFENDDDHEKNFHKIHDPYDWHVHMKIKIKDIMKYLNYIAKRYLISSDEIKNIYNIIFLDKSNLKSNSKSKIEYLGNNSREEAHLIRKKILLFNEYYDTLKYDRNLFNTYLFNYSNYVIRILNLDFKIKDDKLKELKKLYHYLTTKIINKPNNSKKPELKLKLVDKKKYQYYKPSIDKFINPNSNKLFCDLVLGLLDYLNITSNISRKLPNNEYRLIINENEFKLKGILNLLLLNILHKKKSKKKKSSESKNTNKLIDTRKINYSKLVLDSKLYLGVISYIIYNKLYSKKLKEKGINFNKYINKRLNHELAWSVFQVYKFKLLNNTSNWKEYGLHKDLIVDINQLNIPQFQKKINMKNNLDLCSKHLNLEYLIKNANLIKKNNKNNLHNQNIIKNLKSLRMSSLN